MWFIILVIQSIWILFYTKVYTKFQVIVVEFFTNILILYINVWLKAFILCKNSETAFLYLCPFNRFHFLHVIQWWLCSSDCIYYMVFYKLDMTFCFLMVCLRQYRNLAHKSVHTDLCARFIFGCLLHIWWQVLDVSKVCAGIIWFFSFLLWWLHLNW